MHLPPPAAPTKLPGKLIAGMIGIALVGTAAVVAVTWQAGASRAAASEPVLHPARVMTVEYRDTTRSLVLAGTVVPRIETTVGFRVAGKIVRRLVDTGAIVQPGQLVAELDPADYRLAVDNARAAFAAAEADYVRAKADHDRYLQLRNTSAFMVQTLDTRQAAASTALGRMDQAKSQLATAENNLAYTELRADAEGVVTSVLAEVGQVMAQGQGVMKIARTEELEILVGVPEQRLSTIRQLTEASFELWSDAGHHYTARLRELSPSADPMTRTYPARFSVTQKPAFIGLGMTATLSFERPDVQHVAEVPLSAIFQQGTGPAVWVIDRDTDVVMLRPVTVARWLNDTAAISAGVKDGEMIATAGVHKLEPGQRVRPLLPQQAAR
jgi:multidrug efflux system membrane fusion protein